MSALAFTLLRCCWSARYRRYWPGPRGRLRAPRAAIVLWQAIAVAAVLSAFSAGIAIASRLFVPGADGRPTATITSRDTGARLAVVARSTSRLRAHAADRRAAALAVLQVAIATRRRRAHHRMLVDLLGLARDGAAPSRDRAPSHPGRRAAAGLLPARRPQPRGRGQQGHAEHVARRRDRRDPQPRAGPPAGPPRPRPRDVHRGARRVPAIRPQRQRSRRGARCSSRCWPTTPRSARGRAPLARALVACAAGRTPSGALAAGGPSTVLRVRRLGGRGNSLCVSAAAHIWPPRRCSSCPPSRWRCRG